MDLKRKQEIESALANDRLGRYEYEVEGCTVQVSVSDTGRECWARWNVKIPISDVESFERGRAKKFNNKSDAIAWITSNSKPWEDKGPSLSDS